MMNMSFSSWTFWVLFAALFMVHAGLQKWKNKATSTLHVRARKLLLLSFSLGFYLLAAGKLLAVMAASIVLNHLLVHALHRSQGIRRSIVFFVALALNIGALAAFKYAFFIADLLPTNAAGTWGGWRLDQWMLPLGISFYTFQAISYVIDVHRGTLDKPASLLSFATYLTFFPQLVAGPIVRAKAFLPQLERREGELTSSAVQSNILLLVQGMLKKMVLGDMVGAWLVDPVFADPGATSGPFVLLALYGYSLQVYADFSGYTDMAQGMAGLLGIQLPRNFDYPYRATSPSAFWRRWHMSLSAWWKDYVYIPLGGNRRFSWTTILFVLLAWAMLGMRWDALGGWLILSGTGLLLVAAMLMAPAVQKKTATAANVLLVMLLGGLWHGAHLNFLLWGAINGTALALWVLISKPANGQINRWTQAGGWFFTFHVVVFSRIWFRAGSLLDWNESTVGPHPENAWSIAKSLCAQLQRHWSWELPPFWGTEMIWGLWLLALGYALHLMPSSWQAQKETTLHKLPLGVLWAAWCACGCLAVWTQSSYGKPFIYWQF